MWVPLFSRETGALPHILECIADCFSDLPELVKLDRVGLKSVGDGLGGQT